ERAAAHNAEIQSLQNQPLDDESRAALTGALLGLSRSIREASAHYSASLDVNPSQPAVTVRLAGLYVQLAGLTNDGALVLSYLHRARELSQRGMQDAEEFGMTPRPAGSAQSARLAASAPPMEAFTIYAYASYEIGKRESKAALLEEARRALERVRTVGQDPRYFGDGEAMKAFKDSESFRWAMETLSAIAANERQVRKRDTFERTGTAHNLGNRWQLFPQGADQGFVDATRVEGGALVAAVRNQQEDMRVSRLGLREKFASVASVRVVIPALGDSSATRGVHLTRLADAEGGFTGAFDWSLMVGFDAENNLVWEVRAESEKTERSLMRDGKPVIIDPRQYGGDKLKAGDRVELTIDRFVPEPNGSTIRYEIELNGYRISINLLNALGNEEREPLDNANYVAEDGEGVMAIGFYVYGATGATGELKVDECEWVLDSNLARREDQD
ncbi:MAG: hypothetical protein L6Q71_02480, partial [Planctomycetes bacterium]|nr:hypothetical protein [Planctomycetota bacterium]